MNLLRLRCRWRLRHPRRESNPEDILVCVAALRIGRPVKWIEDRREHLISRRPLAQTSTTTSAQLAPARRVEILAPRRCDPSTTNGAYVRTHATRVAMMTCGVLPGPYRIPGAYRAICHFRLTNKTPAATCIARRGGFEATFVRERLIDAIAHQP